jgi:hypothetical protein
VLGVFIVASGDDLLISLSTDNGPVIASIDISRMDMHVAKVWLDHLVLRSMSERFTDTRLGKAAYKAVYAKGRKYAVNMDGFRVSLKVDGTTASGDSVTSSSATEIAIVCALYAAFFRLPVEETFADLGFKVECEFIPLEKFTALTYLQRRFAPASSARGGRDEEWVLCPTLGRASKLFFAMWPDISKRKERKWLRTVAACMLIDAGHCPIYRALCERVIELVGDGPLLKLPEDDHFKVHAASEHWPGPHARDALCDRYQISEADIDAVIFEISQAKLGTRLRHPAWRNFLLVDCVGANLAPHWGDLTGKRDFSDEPTQRDAADLLAAFEPP